MRRQNPRRGKAWGPRESGKVSKGAAVGEKNENPELTSGVALQTYPTANRVLRTPLSLRELHKHPLTRTGHHFFSTAFMDHLH